MKIRKKIKNGFKIVLMMMFMMGTFSITFGCLESSVSVVEAATNIKLNKTKTTLIKGQTFQLKLIGVRGKAVWSSSNKKIAVVNSAGKVTAKTNGSATITAKIHSKKYTCKIQVETPKISKTTVTLYKNGSYTLKMLNTKQKVIWKSSKPSVATVSSKGKVTAKATGTTTVTATVLGKKYNCKITVKQKPVATSKVPVCVSKQTVYARAHRYTEKEYFNYLAIPECFIYIKNLDKNAQVVDITSSNPKITAYKRYELDAIEVDDNSEDNFHNLLGETSTISFKVIQNNKTYNLSCKINVEKGPSPFSELKIGSKNIASHFYGGDYEYINSTSIGKTTLAVKMAPGYVLDSIAAVSEENEEFKTTILKNGSTVNFKNYRRINIHYHTTRKPANYVKETEWYGAGVKSPLHYSCTLEMF